MLVAERTSPTTGQVTNRWTDEEPGVTGPRDLREVADELRGHPAWRIHEEP